MKQNYIHKIAVLFIALYAAFSAYAYDFSNDGIYYDIISKEEHTVGIAGCSPMRSTLNIPNKVTYDKEVYKVIKIAVCAFMYRSDLTRIALPSSLTSIGDCAFEYCSDLTTIALPSSLTSIGRSAFSGCSSLTTIELPSSLTSIGKEAFSDCPITSLIIPASVTEISYNPVMGCRELVSLQVEEANTKFVAIDNVLYDKGMTRVIACAAKEESVSLPNTVTEIAERAFSYCSSLTTIDLPSSITTIGDYAFYGCRSLTTIGLPSSITSIGNYAFGNCSSLTTIALPSSITSIGNYAFRNCSSLTTIDLPSSITTIGDYAFYGCRSLTTIGLPSSVTSIGAYAFEYCSSLTTVALPSSLTSIGAYAFEYCSILTTIALPSSITSIGNGAFSECSSLTTIDLPSSLSEIGWGAFDCENLSEVICRAQTPPSADAKHNIFSDNTYRNGILKVPAESVSQYETSYGWGQFWNIEGIPTSGIKDVNVSKTDVTIRNTGIGNIVLENADGMAVSVYSVDGAVMYQTSEYDGETINIGSGIYVVKCGASVLKVRL